MSIASVIQKLEPGQEVVLFDLDARPITGGGPGDVTRFHGYTQSGDITWQGNVYSPWPIEVSGLEVTGRQQPQPRLTVANVDRSISQLCALYQDLVGAEITIHRTYGEFLDGQPGADPTAEHPLEFFTIESKSAEDDETVEFQLMTGISFAGRQLPGRQIIAGVCSWISIGGYRGTYCGYTGGPVADINDVATTDAALDDCSGSLKGCNFRFPGRKPFGSFPAAGLNRS